VTSGQAEGEWLQWSPGGKLFFDDEDFHSFRMNPDGSARARVPDRDTNAAYGTSCGSEAMVFALIRDNTFNLFRQDLATGEIKQLTFERDAERPTCTGDGKTIYFDNNLDGPALKRVSANGGTAEVLAANSLNASLSADEKRIAFFQFSDPHKVQLVIENVDGGNKSFLPADGIARAPRWAPDGSALILDKFTGAGSNLFYQPIDGGKPTQITHFNSEPLGVSAYAFSPDGKQIAITRARINDSDLVMFSNFR
jgi:Tol biopolymer transport system component